MAAPASPLEITRRSRGLTQVELAELAGVSRDTISRIERGEVPRMRSAIAIAGVLDADLTIFVPVNDERPAVTPGARENSGGQSRHARL